MVKKRDLPLGEEGKAKYETAEISATRIVLPQPTNSVSSTAFIITTVSNSRIVKQKLESCVTQHKIPSPSVTDHFDVQK